MSLRTAIKYEVELGNTKCFTWKDAPTTKLSARSKFITILKKVNVYFVLKRQTDISHSP